MNKTAYAQHKETRAQMRAQAEQVQKTFQAGDYATTTDLTVALMLMGDPETLPRYMTQRIRNVLSHPKVGPAVRARLRMGEAAEQKPDGLIEMLTALADKVEQETANLKPVGEIESNEIGATLAALGAEPHLTGAIVSLVLGAHMMVTEMEDVSDEQKARATETLSLTLPGLLRKLASVGAPPDPAPGAEELVSPGVTMTVGPAVPVAATPDAPVVLVGKPLVPVGPGENDPIAHRHELVSLGVETPVPTADGETTLGAIQQELLATAQPMDIERMVLDSEPGRAMTAFNQQEAEKLRAALTDRVVHRSDCAVHNEPAMPNGPCNCGAVNLVDVSPEDGYANWGGHVVEGVEAATAKVEG